MEAFKNRRPSIFAIEGSVKETTVYKEKSKKEVNGGAME